MPGSPMSVDLVRRFCLSLAHTTEGVQWGSDLVFKVGGKMYAVTCLEPAALILAPTGNFHFLASLILLDYGRRPAGDWMHCMRTDRFAADYFL